MKLNNKTTMSLAAAMGCLAMSATTASAALTNLSFESALNSATDWDQTGAAANTRGATGGLTPTDGTSQVWINGGTTIYQDSGIIIEVGNTYTLTVDVGVTSPFDAHTGTFRLYGSALDFGSALAGAEKSVVTTQSVWELNETTSFVATGVEAGQTLGIALTTTGTQTEWDNVRLTITPVPEPSSAALLGLGGLALILRRRK